MGRNGPLRVEHVRRTQTQRQRRTEKAPEVVAQNISTSNKEEKDKDTPHYVMRVSCSDTLFRKGIKLIRSLGWEIVS